MGRGKDRYAVVVLLWCCGRDYLMKRKEDFMGSVCEKTFYSIDFYALVWKA